MTKNKYSWEQKEQWLKEWEEKSIPAAAYAKEIDVEPTLLYQWRAAKRDRDKKNRAKLLPAPIKHQEIVINKQPPTFQANYCPHCGCPMAAVRVAMNIESE